MENIFLELLNLSITASWLVLAVLLIRLILKNAPKWINCVLWSLVGIRLVLPFSVESVFSLIPSAKTVAPSIVYQQTPSIESGINAVNNVVNPILSEAFAPDPTNSANPLQIVSFIAAVIWIIGISVMLLYTLISYLRLKNKVKTAVLLNENIFQSENVASPFVLGLIKPKIYLPYDMAEADASHVIAHEKAHIKRRDHLIKTFAFLLLTVYWFNPVLWVAYVLLCRDIELACDERVIKSLSKESCKDYSSALLNCSIDRRSIAACPIAFGEVGVKDRVKNVMNYKKPAFRVIIIAVIICIATAVCFLTVPESITLGEAYDDILVNEAPTKIEVITFEKTYTFTSSEQLEKLNDELNNIKINSRADTESVTESTSAKHSVRIYEDAIKVKTLCFDTDFNRVWLNDTDTAYKVNDPDDMRKLFSQKLKSIYIDEQTENQISTLIKFNFNSDPGLKNYACESHYIVEKNISKDGSVCDTATVFALFDCRSYSFDSGKLEKQWDTQGMVEISFNIYDGERVVFDEFTQRVSGDDFVLEGMGSTGEISEKLKKESEEKAKAHFGLVESTLNADDEEEEETGIYAQNEINFSYGIVPIEFKGSVLWSKEIDKIVKSKALNASQLIKNENKQFYSEEYCLIYKETDGDNLLSDYGSLIDVKATGKDYMSLSDAASSYELNKNEKDMYIVYISEPTNAQYSVTELRYIDGALTAVINQSPYPVYENIPFGYFAVIFVDKSVSKAYENFNACIIESPSVLDNYGEVNLDDIADMNIGAEMPNIICFEEGKAVMTGTFGLLVYDINTETVTERINYKLLNKLGIDILNACASEDGKAIYLGRHGENGFMYTYYLDTKQLFECYETPSDLYKKTVSFLRADDDFLYSKDAVVNGFVDGTEYVTLRAKTDWSMSSLQIHRHNIKTGVIEIYDVFR